MGAKAIAFCRRSTEMQDMSLADQRTLLQNWMQTAPIVKEQGIDPEIARFVEYTGTGTRMGEAFEAILEEVRGGGNDYQYVIVEKLDRLHGRMGFELMPYLYELRDFGVWVIPTDRGEIVNQGRRFDERLRLFLDTELSMEESRKLASRMIERNKVKASQGWWVGGTPPFGYVRMEISPEGEEVGILLVGIKARDRFRVKAVLDSQDKINAARRAFEMYAQGESYKAIMKWLRGQGYHTARGGQWSRSSVRDMLMNPIYKGDLTWGKRRSGIFSKDENLWGDSGEEWRHDKDKWIVYHNESLRIVTDDLWNAVQKMFVIRPREWVSRDHAQKFPLLNGLIYCENCGGRFYWREEKRGDRLLRRYQDFSLNRGAYCKRNLIRAETMHDYAISLIEEAMDPVLIGDAFKRAREILKEESIAQAGFEPDIKRMEKQERNLVGLLKDFPNSQEARAELAIVCEQLEQYRVLRSQFQSNGIKEELERLVSCHTCNVAMNTVNFLHNQPRRLGYEEIHRDTC